MPANKCQSVITNRNDDSDNNNNDACAGNNRTVTVTINNHTACDADINDKDNNNFNDNKSQKFKSQNDVRFCRNNKKAGLVLVTLILVLQVVARIRIMTSNRKTSKVEELSASASGATIIRSTDNKSNNNNNAIDNYNKEQQYELYPFLVDSASVTSSLSSSSRRHQHRRHRNLLPLTLPKLQLM